jgi:predicted TIM-barrel fold metal-dependent hydrolase
MTTMKRRNDVPESIRNDVPESIQGIKIVDVDTHLTEPQDLWTSRAPAKYKDRVPKVVRATENNIAESGLRATDFRWVVDGIELGQAGGGSVVNKENVKVKGQSFTHWPLTEVSPAASFVEPRLDLMDEVGIWGQIVYPNVVGFGGQAFSKIQDLELRNLCCTIWNDAMIEMHEQSGGRIMGMATLPWWDIDSIPAEAERIHRLGLKGVNISADPQDSGMPDLNDPCWEPLWDVCEDLNLPINFHIGASQTQSSWFGTAPWPSFGENVKLALGSTVLYLGNARVLGNLIYSGILARHPKLKFVSVESGIGWIPFLLQALDYQAEEANVHHLSMKPSDYFRRQMYACFWFEGTDDHLIDDIKRVGRERCMFETDFPHPTCLYPDPLTGIASTLEAVDYETRKMILGGNAAKVYNIDLPTG